MKNDTWAIALRIMARISGWIAFPVILGAFLGKWLDKRYDSEPLLFLITVAVSFIVSMYGLVINALKEFKKIEADSQLEKKESEEKNQSIKK